MPVTSAPDQPGHAPSPYHQSTAPGSAERRGTSPAGTPAGRRPDHGRRSDASRGRSRQSRSAIGAAGSPRPSCSTCSSRWHLLVRQEPRTWTGAPSGSCMFKPLVLTGWGHDRPDLHLPWQSVRPAARSWRSCGCRRTPVLSGSPGVTSGSSAARRCTCRSSSGANIGVLYRAHFYAGLPFTGLVFASTQSGTLVNNVFVVAILALGLNEAAYAAELVRAGIISVDAGQTEAAHRSACRRRSPCAVSCCRRPCA